MEVIYSARKHGIEEEDAKHADEHVMAIEVQDDGSLLCIGPSRSGALIEIAKVVRDDGSECLFHAMPLRAKHKRLLPGYRTPRRARA